MDGPLRVQHCTCVGLFDEKKHRKCGRMRCKPAACRKDSSQL